MMTCARCEDKHDGFPPCSLYDDMFCPYYDVNQSPCFSLFDFDHE